MQQVSGRQAWIGQLYFAVLGVTFPFLGWMGFRSEDVMEDVTPLILASVVTITLGAVVGLTRRPPQRVVYWLDTTQKAADHGPLFALAGGLGAISVYVLTAPTIAVALLAVQAWCSAWAVWLLGLRRSVQ